MEGALNLGRIAGNWGALFSGPLFMHTSPEALSAGTLTVNVDSPSWLHQASFLRHQMLTKLKALGVTSIRFRLGPVNRLEQVHVSSQDDPDLTLKEEAEVEAMLGVIEDNELRESIRGAALRSLSRGKRGRGKGLQV